MAVLDPTKTLPPKFYLKKVGIDMIYGNVINREVKTDGSKLGPDITYPLGSLRTHYAKVRIDRDLSLDKLPFSLACSGAIVIAGIELVNYMARIFFNFNPLNGWSFAIAAATIVAIVCRKLFVISRCQRQDDIIERGVQKFIDDSKNIYGLS